MLITKTIFTIVLGVAISLQSFANHTFAQTKITLNLKNVNLEAVLKNIEKQTNYRFAYSDEVILNNLIVSVDVKNEEIDKVLTDVLANTPLTFQKKNKDLFYIKKELNATAVNYMPAPPPTNIKGTVTNEKGEPIVGASVFEKGTKNGASTNTGGSFNLNIKDKTTTVLVVSAIGYNTKEVLVKDGNVENITLVAVESKLDEVVVVGYGTQKRVNLTGAVNAISVKDLKDRPNPNLLASIQGQIPGVTIISRPGQTPSINFRGRGNLGTSAPLFVINGIIADQNIFSNLDPNSIESISFLKDAASSSIYGSRAAYGVVLVTTKNGKKGKIDISYSGIVGTKSPSYLPKMLNSAQYAELQNEAAANRGASAPYTQAQIDTFRNGTNLDYYPNSNWFDLALDKSVLTTQHSLNLSGGTDRIRYYTGLGFMYDDQFLPGQDNKRYNLHSKLSSDVTSWLTVNTDISYIRNQSTRKNGATSTYHLLFEPPTMVAKQSNGDWGSIAGGKRASQTYINYNPLRELSKKDWSNGTNANTILDLSFDLKPFKGFVITGQGSYTGIDNQSKSYTGLLNNVKDFVTGNEIPGTGNAVNKMDVSLSNSVRMLYSAFAKYQWTNDVHDVAVMAGTSYETNKFEALSASRKNFPIDGLVDLSAGSSAATDITNDAAMSEFKLQSYFGRINYGFLGRYLLEANIRRDGSSRFYKDNRWGIFPSFSAGWIASEEAFLKNVSWLNLLKLRGSYGTLGNINNVGNYDYFQNYTNNLNYNFEGTEVQGISEAKPANTSLTWEKVAITNIGIDVELLKRKLTFTAEYYIKKTSNILLGYNVPLETGIPSKPSQNIGKLQNNGVEFALNYKDKFRNLTYNIGANLSINKNKITDLATSDNMIYNGGDIIQYIYKVGSPIGSYYGYVANGLYTQEEITAGKYYRYGRAPKAGDIKYVPQRTGVANGGSITGDDRTIIGCDVPTHTYGVNIGLQYKGFDFAVFGQGINGASVAFENNAYLAFFENGNAREFHLNRWTTANPNASAIYPRIYGNSLDDYNRKPFSQYQLFDADYFRIKMISLGFKFPSALLAKQQISSARFFINLENMFTIRADKKMKDFDPETASSRALGIGTKTVSFGVNITF